MASLQSQIVAMIAAHLTAAGIVTHIWPDGDEVTSTPTVATWIVCDSDDVTQRNTLGTERRMSGHVILEDSAAVGLERAESDALRVKVENALLTLEETIPLPAILFEIDGYQRTFSGEDGGRIGARINWSATYRHKPRDITAVPS